MNGWLKLGVKLNLVDTHDREEQRKICENWLRHPGTALAARSLCQISKKKLLDYDKAILAGDMAKAREIAAFRHAVETVLPDVIGYIMNERVARAHWRWKFKTWLIHILGRKRSVTHG